VHADVLGGVPLGDALPADEASSPVVDDAVVGEGVEERRPVLDVGRDEKSGTASGSSVMWPARSAR
jgi:hypothetical protein